jgi:hypothetical protein
MTSKERILACLNGNAPDHVPFTTWCFGFKPKRELTWERNGKPVSFWYSLRMEHIHQFPEPWGLEDDFRRVQAWQSLGVDDILDISVPWSMDPEVSWKDSVIPRNDTTTYPVMVREYATPSGTLRHAVSRTDEEPGEGWVVQPDHVPLFDDYNIPRGIEHAVRRPADVPLIQHLYRAPGVIEIGWFNRRMEKVGEFSRANGIAVQAWTAFGMDGIIWLTGVEGALLMAMDDPRTFARLAEIIAEADYGRTALACTSPSIDIIVQRGWYSSTDFWSPKLFDEFIYPHIVEIARLAHHHGKKFGYVMTTGVEALGNRLIDAGVDVLYFIDPLQDKFPLEKARDMLSSHMTMPGGVNSVGLTLANRDKIRGEVQRSLNVLGPTNRFILHPVDALFPDTPWESVEILLETWEKYR